MEENGIICIDSSDEENSPCKIRKRDIQSNSTIGIHNFNNIKISEITTQAVEDDVVLIEEHDLLNDKKYLSRDNGKHKKECDIKRVKLTTLEENIVNIGDCTLSPKAKDENIFKLKNLNTSEVCTETNISNTDPSASTSHTESSIELESFLEACRTCNCDKKYKDMMLKKIPDLRSKYVEADETFVTSQHFKKYLIHKTIKVQQKPINAIVTFNEVYKELESKRKHQINLTDREKNHLRKLHKALRKVHKKVVHLENQDVNFEDDSNSSYIMLERYKERFCTIQKKICSLTNENFYLGRELFKNLNCRISAYPEINRSINKLYNKKKQFPSFYEIDNCIRKCVKSHNLNISENSLNAEIRSVFTDVGQVLQRRRKSELHDSLSYFLEGSYDDPAENDPEFESMLHTRHLENEKKIDEILQKYADSQEKGEEEPVLSSDSDDSHYTSDDFEA